MAQPTITRRFAGVIGLGAIIGRRFAGVIGLGAIIGRHAGAGRNPESEITMADRPFFYENREAAVKQMRELMERAIVQLDTRTLNCVSLSIFSHLLDAPLRREADAAHR